jgi:hypothetical protein
MFDDEISIIVIYIGYAAFPVDIKRRYESSGSVF